MSVIHVESDEQFATEMQAAANAGKVVVVDFFATWCGPCVRIAPVFSQLSVKYNDSTFLKVDVDKCKGSAETQGVSAMPTFRFYRGSKQVDELRGADPVELTKKVETHCSGAGASASGAVQIGSYVDLNPHIDFKNSECLNESDTHTFRKALSKEEEGHLESDCDEQLLLTITFQQPVKIHSLLIQGPSNGQAPKNVKLFINTTSMDFDSAENGKSVQEFELTADTTAEGVQIPLKYVKFQTVNSLTMFVRDNQGDEEVTIIERVGIMGQLREKSDMNEFKRVSGQKGEAHG